MGSEFMVFKKNDKLMLIKGGERGGGDQMLHFLR